MDPKGFLVQKPWKSKRYAFIGAGSAHNCFMHELPSPISILAGFLNSPLAVLKWSEARAWRSVAMSRVSSRLPASLMSYPPARSVLPAWSGPTTPSGAEAVFGVPPKVGK
jgi:hypothetical protein